MVSPVVELGPASDGRRAARTPTRTRRQTRRTPQRGRRGRLAWARATMPTDARRETRPDHRNMPACDAHADVPDPRREPWPVRSRTGDEGKKSITAVSSDAPAYPYPIAKDLCACENHGENLLFLIMVYDDETRPTRAQSRVSAHSQRAPGGAHAETCARPGAGTARDAGGRGTAVESGRYPIWTLRARRSAPAPTLRPHATLSSSFAPRLHRRHARLHLRARGGPMARGVALVLQPRHAARWHRAAEIGGLDLGVARGHEAGAKDVEQLGPFAGQLREADVLAAEVLRGLRTPSIRGALRHPVGRPEERESRSPQACSSRRRLETSSSARVLGEDSISSRSPPHPRPCS